MSEDMKKIHSRTLISTESCEFTWSIENFSSCGLIGQEHVCSPMFTTGTSLLTTWCLRIYPNKNKTTEKDGSVGLYLRRTSKDSSAHYATFSMSLIDSNQTKRYSTQFEHLYDEASCSWGIQCLIQRTELFGPEQSVLLPQDILTVMCELKISRVDDYKDSELTELPKPTTSAVVFKKPDPLVGDLQKLYATNLYSDLTLKVGGEVLKVHKNILCARSSVFNTMLNCEMKEKLTNTVAITDYDLATVKIMLHYIYCGQVEGLTPEIGIQIYSAAEKYDLQDLKDICVEYLSRNLSVDNFCDVLILASLHNEDKLFTSTKNFFSVKAVVIKESEKWLKFSETNPDLVIAMYEFMYFQKSK